MRILFINKYHYLKGGAERCYFDTAEIFKRRGHEVAFFAMRHPKNKPTEWSRYFIDQVDYNNPALNWRQKAKMAAKIIYNRQARQNLEALIKKFRPQIAHLHNIYHQISPAVLYSLKKFNIPAVMTLHDYKLICPNYNLYVRGQIWEKSKPSFYYRCLLDRCVKDSYLKSLICALEAYWHKLSRVYGQIDVFISPSQFLIKKFKEFNFPYPIQYLPNPLLKDKFLVDNLGEAKKYSALFTALPANYILFTGRLSQEKGVDDLLRALALAKNQEIKLVVAGQGPQERQLKKLSQELGLRQRVLFVGHLPWPALQAVIKKSLFVVVPSRWYENAPYSVIEAMALTKNIVCAKMGGLPELVGKDRGFLYPAGDIKKLSEIIDFLANNKEENIVIGQRAKQFIDQLSGAEKYYHQLFNIYKNLI